MTQDRSFTPWEKALDKLVAVHRDWCNYCQGDAVRCSDAPVGGCSLRDYLIALDAVPSENLPKSAVEMLPWATNAAPQERGAPLSEHTDAVTEPYQAEPAVAARDGQFDKEDLLQRLFAAMGCDDLEMAVLQAELDARESLKAAEAIRQCAGLPENVWPSPHERRFFIALKEHLSARGEFVDPGEEYDGWAEKEKAEELLREIRQMTDNAGIQRKIADYFHQYVGETK